MAALEKQVAERAKAGIFGMFPSRHPPPFLLGTETSATLKDAP
jgi:hypothetical protein